MIIAFSGRELLNLHAHVYNTGNPVTETKIKEAYQADRDIKFSFYSEERTTAIEDFTAQDRDTCLQALRGIPDPNATTHALIALLASETVSFALAVEEAANTPVGAS